MIEYRLHLLHTGHASLGRSYYLAQACEFGVVVAAQFEYRFKRGNGLVAYAPFAQFALDVVDAYLVEFVDSYRDVDHLVGMADSLGDAVENLAVVHLQGNRYAQLVEYSADDIYELHLAQKRV